VVREILFSTPGDVPVRLEWRRTEGGHFHSLAVHDEVEIQYIKSGVGAYAIGHRIWPFRGRMLFVVHSNVPHRFQPNPKGLVEKVFVAFRPSVLKEPWARAMIRALPVSLQLAEPDATRIETCYRTIRAEIEARPPHWKDLTAGELVKLLILIQRAAQPSRPAPDHRVVRATEYLDAHFRDAVTVPGLAQIAGMSASHLAHRFKQQVRMGIRQYLLQSRIAEAKSVLEKTPDIKLAALAAQLGFSNFALFNRAFRHLTGMSPSDWRRIAAVTT
jgi:AraC-like DNA-binding protein